MRAEEVRKAARDAALAYVDSRFNTGQRGALEHAADAASDVWQAFVSTNIAEAEEVTLCCVCGEPVWPSLTLWQRPEGRSLAYGHRRCLDDKYVGESDDPGAAS
jgi:hypothetical protein